MKDYLTGIFPPIPTPFNPDGEINYERLKFNLSQFEKYDLKGYVVFGSNGESVFLTREEKIRMIGEVREHTSEGKVLIAGTGTDSIIETILLSNEAAKSGANFALVITPFFYQKAMSHKALIDYYSAVADEVTIPIIIYNVSKFTNVNIAAITVAELSKHENIVGIKNSTENIAEITEMTNLLPENFAVLAGTGSVLFPALMSGCIGGVLALANIAAQNCIEIHKKYFEGRMDEAKEIQSRMISVNKAVTSTYGVPGLKAAMDLLSFYGGPPRKPLQPLDKEQIQDLKIILTRAKLL